MRGALLVPTVAALAVVAACGGGDGDGDRAQPVQPISSSVCSPMTTGGEDAARHLVVLVGPLQNAVADHGIQNAQAAKLVLAQREWRAGDASIGLQVCDEASADEYSDGPKCERIAKAVSANHGVVAVLGPTVSTCASLMLPVLNRAPGGPVAMLGLGNTYVGLTREGPGVEDGDPERYRPSGDRSYLRTMPADDVQGAASVLAAQEAGAKRVFAIHDGTRYGRGVATAFSEASTRAGLEDAGTAPWDPEASGYRALAGRIAGARADAVFLGGGAQSNGPRLIRDLRGGLGKDVLLLGPDGFNQPAAIIEGAGERAEGLTVSLSAASNSALPPRGRAWAAEFARRYGSRPCCYAVHAGQATELVLDAIESSDGTRAGVLRALQRTRTAHGLLGSIRFDEFGDSSLRGVSLYRIEGGRMRYMRTVEVPDDLVGRD
jgi:branched-chain amino acid transport system substrate-binding protein